MKTLYKVLLLPIFSAAFAEAPGQATFIRTYDLPLGATVTSIAPTDDGGMIVSGYVDGVGLLYRFDAIGNLEWSRRYYDEGGTFLGTEPHQVEFVDVEALNGGFFIVGRSEHATVDTLTNYQRLIMKTTVLGEVEWMKHSGMMLWYDELNAVASYDQTHLVAVGRRGSIGGQRAWLNKMDIDSGTVVGTVGPYYWNDGNTTGNFTHVHCPSNGMIIATGSGMITAFDESLDSLWAIPLGLSGLADLDGSHAFADGSGVVMAQNRIIGFSATGTIQFAKELDPALGSADALAGDANGVVYIVGTALDGSNWLSAMNNSGDILWTKGYEAGLTGDVVDMTVLSDGRIAGLKVLPGSSAMELMATTSDEVVSACENQAPTPLWTAMTITLTPGLSFPTPTVAGFTPLFPVAITDYSQGAIECSQGVFTASGNAYIDTNENGELDPGEDLALQRMIILQPNGTTAWTGDDGYSFIIGDIGEYEVEHQPLPYWNLTEGADGYMIELTENDTVLTGLDFGHTPAYDTTVVTASAVSGPLRCMIPHEQFLTVGNLGTTHPDLLVVYSFDTLLTYESAQPQPDSIGTGILYWSIDALGYFTEQQFEIDFMGPYINIMGDSLLTSVQVFDISNGMEPELLMEYQLGQLVLCSYDPNDKLVAPAGEGVHGGIDNEVEWLDYTVRFQNTGNDTAFTVMIHDQLSPYLDRFSIDVLGHSHELTGMNMSSSGLVEFRFDDIMLPDSTTDQLGSQGFIHYKVQLMPDLPVGTVINNNAGIFFDQNPAIITNTVINTIRDCTVDQPIFTIQLYQEGYLVAYTDDIDPFEDEFTYTWFLDGQEIYVSNMAGIEVFEDGIYTVEVTDLVGCVNIPEPYALIGMSIVDAGHGRITVRPNPFSDGTLIEFDHTLSNYALIELLDIQGRIVRSAHGSGSKQYYLHRGELEAGVYLIRVIQGDRQYRVRVVVE